MSDWVPNQSGATGSNGDAEFCVGASHDDADDRAEIFAPLRTAPKSRSVKARDQISPIAQLAAFESKTLENYDSQFAGLGPSLPGALSFFTQWNRAKVAIGQPSRW